MLVVSFNRDGLLYHESVNFLPPFLSELGSDQEDESVSKGGAQSYTKN